MKKLITVIKKNIKLLARSKGSAFVVLLAPLIIVLIIGVGFNDQSQAVLNIGIQANDTGELTQRYIANLNSSGNKLIMYDDEDSCIRGIKEGIVLTCIVFPQDFTLEDGKINEIHFFVDDSRMNLVYRLVSDLSTNIENESSEVTQELTTRLLNIITKTSNEADITLTKLISIKSQSESIKTTSTGAKSGLQNLDTEEVPVPVSGLTSGITTVSSDFSNIRNKAKSVVEDGYEVVEEIDEDNITKDLENSLESLGSAINNTNGTLEELDDLENKISKVEDNVESLANKLEQSGIAKTSTLIDLDKIINNINSIQSDADLAKQSQEKIQAEIATFTIRNAENIASPITTKILPVTASTSKIAFSFPYLLMLVVLFVGMMLSSTLIWMEKDSRAYFRNFTTPAKNAFFLSMTYITSILIILLQVILILAAVHFLLHVPILTNLHVTIAPLLLGITVFILLGMVIGYLFNTSEAMTMSTIAVGAILLFFSNLILPIETLSPIIQKITSFNPYVLTSETLRKTILFGATYKTVYMDLLILLGYAVILLVLGILLNKFSLSRLTTKLHTKFGKATINLPEDHYLLILEKDIVIKNLSDLLDAFRKLSDEEYANLTRPENIFSKWLRENLKAKRLASKLRKKDRQKAIDALLKYLNEQ